MTKEYPCEFDLRRDLSRKMKQKNFISLSQNKLN